MSARENNSTGCINAFHPPFANVPLPDVVLLNRRRMWSRLSRSQSVSFIWTSAARMSPPSVGLVLQGTEAPMWDTFSSVLTRSSASLRWTYTRRFVPVCKGKCARISTDVDTSAREMHLRAFVRRVKISPRTLWISTANGVYKLSKSQFSRVRFRLWEFRVCNLFFFFGFWRGDFVLTPLALATDSRTITSDRTVYDNWSLCVSFELVIRIILLFWLGYVSIYLKLRKYCNLRQKV